MYFCFMCYRFLATGNSFRSLAFSFRLGENSVRDIVYSKCSAILEKMQPILWASPEEMFRTKWNSPNVVAALDDKHVLIQAPPHTLVDANYTFLAVDVGAFGKHSDANIFINSEIGKLLSEEITNIPHANIGDEAFPLRTYLMRLHSRDNVQGDEEKKIFNYRVIRARNTVENTFGILACRFRIFER
ncbi:hypothetical protein PR048_029167 [Dryococelus australis]|uniref:DDE Tnp4 domain-containing protein n=1 Tax=Dryococelus australis TaxID=614101 RepID=A0ABQ9GCL4_9NEOP|nr:hypothetical protein PR048_029167 [Dryococelus australis]